MSRTRRFVSAQWPYLYDVPALHRCVPMLFGDVMARYYRLRGDDVYFLCGADEHGARIEYVAEGLGTAPDMMVEGALARTRPLLAQLELSFDELGRTGDPAHQAWVKAFFADLKRVGALEARDVTVAWCEHCARVLPDRFVEGRCPTCNGRAFGNQCQDKMVCGRLLKPAELREPKCSICADPASTRTRKHWAMKLQPYVSSALEGLTSSTAYLEEVRTLAHRVVDECPEVVLTRDFRHGVQIDGPDGQPVCVDGWVDSLLAKISFTDRAGHTLHFREPSTEKVFFLGRDGLPFYTVLLPALLAASKRGYASTRWHVQPNQVFVDEGGICSKSTGSGIWLAEALASVPAELWRFYVYYAYAARAEERDVAFRWERFAEVTNAELIEPLESAVQRLAGTLGAGVPAWREDPAARDVARAIAATADEAARLLDQHRTGRALHRLLAGIKQARDVDPSAALAAGARDALPPLLPLLGCYLPGVAQRSWARLGLRGSPAAVRVADGSVVDDAAPQTQGPLVFSDGPIRARDAQREYQRRVDERRRGRTLDEEITAARADKLCACPSELTES